jgi:hypothetical protein
VGEPEEQKQSTMLLQPGDWTKTKYYAVATWWLN